MMGGQCDSCGEDQVGLQLCSGCVKKMVESIKKGPNKDGKYEFNPFAYFSEMSGGGKKK